MFPVLAAVTGAQAAGDARFTQRAAWVGAVLVPFVALGLFVYSARATATCRMRPGRGRSPARSRRAGGLAALLPGLRAHARAAAGVTALSAILAWQCLLCAYARHPAVALGARPGGAVRPYVGPQTRLYSVGQYRETVSPYLGRTLHAGGIRGRAAVRTERGAGQAERDTAAVCRAPGSASREAVAFFDPRLWDEWRRRGLPGRVMAADNYTVAVSRW